MSSDRTDAPGPLAMSDDTREREPLRDRGDNPAEAGTRSDHAGTGASPAGLAPGGGETAREIAARTQDHDGEPPAGQGTAGGGGTA